MSSFVESLKRLYDRNAISKETVEKQLKDGRITHGEYLYITQGKEV